jgi:hypothetical protein
MKGETSDVQNRIKQAQIGRRMENRIGQDMVRVELWQEDFGVPRLVLDWNVYGEIGRCLLYFRKIHRRTGAICERVGRLFLAALLGMATIVIPPTRNHRRTRQARASKKYEDHNHGNQNGSGRACHVLGSR